MRINVLQHTPNEGPGAIKDWAHVHRHELYVYHPYQFNGILPTASETDMLIILGGPMSPNDSEPWILQERQLIAELLQKKRPIFGACFGAQQIAKTLGAPIGKAAKEVGWAPVYLKSNTIPDIPPKLTALHWHEEKFAIPQGAELLFSSDLLETQGFVLNHRIIGLQFHFEPQADDIREIVVNDASYTENSLLHQSPEDILNRPVPAENKLVMFKLLDYITKDL